MALSSDRARCIEAVSKKLEVLLDGTLTVYCIDDLSSKELHIMNAASAETKESAVAQWVFTNNQPAGFSTDTLSSSPAYTLPLKGPSIMVGVVAFTPTRALRVLVQEEKSLLTAVAGQLAMTLEKDLYQQRAQEVQKLEASEHLHQTILSTISHEIKTPMTAIVGLASALADDQIHANPALRHQLIQELGDAVDRLNSEVNNILDMSRLSSGVFTLKKEWIPVRELLTPCVDKLKKPLSTHPLTLTVPDALPFLHVDVGLLGTALGNILLNAATVTPDGSAIEITVSLLDGQMCIEISDHGPGIPESELGRIFEKFFRLPDSPPGGSGLGLAIAHSVVLAHRGTISAMNRPTGGLTVMVVFPCEDQPIVPPEARA
jgi:two-component system sensor histidine kinase KdpD